MCWAKATKSQCWKTCGVCSFSDLKDTGSLKTRTYESYVWTINAGKSAVIKSRNSKRVYIGQIGNNKFSGAGYLINDFKEGDSYLGTFKDGKYHGKGTYTFASGDVYTGAFIKNSFEGIGTFVQKTNGETYTG